MQNLLLVDGSLTNSTKLRSTSQAVSLLWLYCIIYQMVMDLTKWGKDGYTGWNVTSDSVGDGD